MEFAFNKVVADSLYYKKTDFFTDFFEDFSKIVKTPILQSKPLMTASVIR